MKNLVSLLLFCLLECCIILGFNKIEYHFQNSDSDVIKFSHMKIINVIENPVIQKV